VSPSARKIPERREDDVHRLPPRAPGSAPARRSSSDLTAGRTLAIAFRPEMRRLQSVGSEVRCVCLSTGNPTLCCNTVCCNTVGSGSVFNPYDASCTSSELPDYLGSCVSHIPDALLSSCGEKFSRFTRRCRGGRPANRAATAATSFPAVRTSVLEQAVSRCSTTCNRSARRRTARRSPVPGQRTQCRPR